MVWNKGSKVECPSASSATSRESPRKNSGSFAVGILIALLTDGLVVRKILAHLGSQPLAPAWRRSLT